MQKLIIALATLCVGVGLAESVYAAVHTNSATGPWTNAGTWSSTAGGVPGMTDTARLGDGAYNGLTVTIGTGDTAAVQTLRLGAANNKTGTIEITGGQLNAYGVSYFGNNGHGVVNQNGGAFNGGGKNVWIGANTNGDGDYQLTAGSFTNMNILHIGRNGNGSLELGAAGAVQGRPLANVFIGRYAGSTGLMSVTAGTWDNGRKEMHVGREGGGTLRLAGGALTNVLTLTAGYTNGGVGTIALDVGGRIWGPTNATRIGWWHGGIGRVVQTGGSLDAGGRELQIGSEPGSAGTYQLSAGSLTNFQALFVGRRGQGTFQLSSTGLVKGNQPYSLHVGRFAGSTGLVTQTGGTWNAGPREYRIGSAGKGTWNITGGLVTNSNNVFIAYDATGEGTVSVSGSGELQVGANALVIGRAGKGTLQLGPDGKVILADAAANTKIGHLNGSTGLAIVTGGTWDNGNRDLHLGYNAEASGTLHISGGIVTNVNNLYNGYSNSSTNLVRIGGSSATICLNNYRQKPNSGLHVAPGAAGLSVITCTNGLWLDGALTIDFSNHDPLTSTLPLITYNGPLNGTAKAFTSTNILTADWSAEVEVDTIGKTVSLINITPPPGPPGTVLIVK